MLFSVGGRLRIIAMSDRLRRHLLVGTITLVALLILGFAGKAALRHAEELIRDRIIAALGPFSSVGSTVVALDGIVLRDLRLGQPQMPAADVLVAHRIHLTPELGDLFLGRLTFSRLRIEGAQLTLLRDAHGWQFPLPDPTKPGQTLGHSSAPQEPTPPSSGRSTPPIRIQRVEISNASLEIVDSVIARPPYHLRFEQLDLLLHPLRIPDFDGQTAITLSATLPGGKSNGKLTIAGFVTPATRDYGLNIRLRNAELGIARPYVAEGRLPFSAGMIDLDLDIDCRQNQIFAPGTLTMKAVELGGPGFNRLSVAQRIAAQAALRESRGQIAMRFTAEGRCTAPRLNPQSSPQARLVQTLFRALGLGLTDLARALGGELPR